MSFFFFFFLAALCVDGVHKWKISPDDPPCCLYYSPEYFLSVWVLLPHQRVMTMMRVLSAGLCEGEEAHSSSWDSQVSQLLNKLSWPDGMKGWTVVQELQSVKISIAPATDLLSWYANRGESIVPGTSRWCGWIPVSPGIAGVNSTAPQNLPLTHNIFNAFSVIDPSIAADLTLISCKGLTYLIILFPVFATNHRQQEDHKKYCGSL